MDVPELPYPPEGFKGYGSRHFAFACPAFIENDWKFRVFKTELMCFVF